MPLGWEGRHRHLDCGNHGTQDSRASSQRHQTDVPDVVLLSRHHWALSAEREALNEAVTLVDTLLGRDALRRRCTSLDLFHRAMSRARCTVDEDISTEERRASMESIFLRTSLDDLCRRRSAHADFDSGLVGSGRLRRQNAWCGRLQNRWRCREDNTTQGTAGNDQGAPVEMLKRQPRSSQQRVMYDEPLIRTPRRANAARPRTGFCRERDLCTDLMGNEDPPERLSALSCQPNSNVDNEQELIEALPPALEQVSSCSDINTSSVAPRPTGSESTELNKSYGLEDAIRNQLECPVCLDYLCPPIKQCANGHCVCSGCSPRLSHCATCRASFISTSNVVLDNLVRSLCFPCRYRDAGCTEILKMEQRPGHEEVCPFRPRKCPTACCDWQGLPDECKSHITSSHQHHMMNMDEYSEFSFCVDRNDGVPTIVHDEQFVVFVDSEMFVFESHYDLWRSKFFAELRRVAVDTAQPNQGSRRFVYDVELYTRSKTVHLKLRNLVNDETHRSPSAIKIDLDVFNHFVKNGQYTLHMRIASIEDDD